MGNNFLKSGFIGIYLLFVFYYFYKSLFFSFVELDKYK